MPNENAASPTGVPNDPEKGAGTRQGWASRWASRWAWYSDTTHAPRKHAKPHPRR